MFAIAFGWIVDIDCTTGFSFRSWLADDHLVLTFRHAFVVGWIYQFELATRIGRAQAYLTTLELRVKSNRCTVDRLSIQRHGSFHFVE